jgi:hypothetical protein
VARSTHEDAELLSRLPTAFTYRQARERGLSEWALRQLRAHERITAIGRGLYERTDSPAADADLLAAALRAPRATLCLRSALARHNLVDDIPADIDLALPRGTRAPALDGPYAWHRFDPATFDLGRAGLDIGAGASIGLYSAERSIIDAFRLRRIEGPELGHDALRRWLATRGAQPAALLRLAAQFPRTQAPLRRALEVLL